MNPHPRDPKWKAVTVTVAEVMHTLRCKEWMTVAEVARRLHLLRPVYLVQVAKILRARVRTPVVESRIRSRASRGRGPLEYRKVKP